MGSTILTVAGMEELRRRFCLRLSALVKVVCVLAALWTCRTVARNKVWTSREALFRYTLTFLFCQSHIHRTKPQKGKYW